MCSGTEKDDLCAFTSLEITLRKPLLLPRQSKEILEVLLCTFSSCENTLSSAVAFSTLQRGPGSIAVGGRDRYRAEQKGAQHRIRWPRCKYSSVATVIVPKPSENYGSKNVTTCLKQTRKKKVTTLDYTKRYKLETRPYLLLYGSNNFLTKI